MNCGIWVFGFWGLGYGFGFFGRVIGEIGGLWDLDTLLLNI